MKKTLHLMNIGTEIELAQLDQVKGGALFDPSPIVLWKNAAQQVYNAGKTVVHDVVSIGKSVWHTITSWF